MQSTNFRTPERWNSVLVPQRVAERAHTKWHAEGECWVSDYSTASHGYAQIGWRDHCERHVVLAHRASWVFEYGQVPLGMTLDHICKNRKCVNPAHLRLLPNFENARRINGEDWPIGTCRRGHDASHLKRKKRKTKSGQPRWGWTCGACERISREKYLAHKGEEAIAKYKHDWT